MRITSYLFSNSRFSRIAVFVFLSAMCDLGWSQSGAPSDIMGFVQAEAVPGRWVDLSPVVLPASVAGGTVTVRSGSATTNPRALALWYRSLQTPSDPLTSYIWPVEGPLIGRPVIPNLLDGYFWNATPWTYNTTDGSSFVASDIFGVGNRLLLAPYFLIDEVAGPASLWEENTQFNFKTSTAVVKPDSDSIMQWTFGSLMGPGLVAENTFSPFRLQRPSNSDPAQRKAFVTVGTASMGSPGRLFIIRPGGENYLFRPDGQPSKPLLGTKPELILGPLTSSKITILGGNSYETADKVRLYNRQTGEDEVYFFNTVGAKWNRRVVGSNTNVVLTEPERLEIELQAGASVFVERRSSVTTISRVTLPFPTNEYVGTKIVAPITSNEPTKDKDIMPDRWEESHFPALRAVSILPNADPDFDGMTNAEEYLLGGDPAAFDHPGLLDVAPQMDLTTGRVGRVDLRFMTGRGCCYRLETKAADESVWTELYTDIRGNGQHAYYQHDASGDTGRAARFYRVVGVQPVDTDFDGLTDYEEWSIGTKIDDFDSDGDGVNDGTEMKTANRNPLDFWDNGIFSFEVSGDRQIVKPGAWTQEPIKVNVSRKLGSSTTPLPSNLTVKFTLSRGVGKFSQDREGAGEVSLDVRVTLSADGKTGTASAYLFAAEETPGTEVSFTFGGDTHSESVRLPIQGLCSVRVDSDPDKKIFYNESFCVYPSEALIPPKSLLGWFSPESGVTSDAAGAVGSWKAIGALTAGGMPGFASPKLVRDTDLVHQKAWVRFAGSEGLLLSELPEGSYSIIAVAQGTKLRTTAAASTATAGLTSGMVGQFYLFSGVLPDTVSGLPDPYDASTYRSYGLSLGAASAGLFNLSQQPSVSSTSLLPSTPATGTSGVVVSLLSEQDGLPVLRVGGRIGPAVTAQLGTAPNYPPRFIGGRLGGLANNGMFSGDLGEFMVFCKRTVTDDFEQTTDFEGFLSPEEASLAEDILIQRYTVFTKDKGYVSLIPVINRDINTSRTAALKESLPDWWERTFIHQYGMRDINDPDGDLLTNAQEFLYGTHPLLRDTDGDGLDDRLEAIVYKSNPCSWDSDNDLIADREDIAKINDAANGRLDADLNGLLDGWDKLLEVMNVGTDSDGDGMSDLFEVAWLNTNPNVADSGDTDLDGIADIWEMLNFGDLTSAGSETSSKDGDGISDKDEFLLGLDPKIKDLSDLQGVLIQEDVRMDDQGRMKTVGDQEWTYDDEGNITSKN